MAKSTPTMEEAMLQLQNTDHHISKEKAINLINKFKTHRNRLFKAKKGYCTLPFNAPGLPLALTYNKLAIQDLLDIPDCIALRLYPSVNSAGQFTMVIAAVNASGDNIIIEPSVGGDENSLISGRVVTGLLDEGQASPPYPAPVLGL